MWTGRSSMWIIHLEERRPEQVIGYCCLILCLNSEVRARNFSWWQILKQTPYWPLFAQGERERERGEIFLSEFKKSTRIWSIKVTIALKAINTKCFAVLDIDRQKLKLSTLPWAPSPPNLLFEFICFSISYPVSILLVLEEIHS